MSKIRKIQVSMGICWVEIPEADVYIQCGCPADSVKHLMKRGLIVTTELNGTEFETGPNVILLSDVMLQNGNFSNLAEFPVLQMLYRQGMMIPGHPNNTGEKPIIMGLKEQIHAQMRYIYRGNYGLISKEELLETGISETMAEEMMQMKLKFAFGKIKESRELLDSRIVGGERIEVKNGVFIKRLGLNRYEIDYDGEKTVVDINLGADENYETPYPLGFYDIRREYFGVIHSGEGDGWDINRPCMSSIVMFQGRIYLIDAGPNIVASLNALGIGVNEIEGIFHTHAHDDHFAGLTTLMRADHKIKYYATKLVRMSVTKKLSALLSFEEDNISNYFDIVDLEFDKWNDIQGLEVKPLFSPHPVETNLFVFRTLWEDGYMTYAHLADICSLDVLAGMIKQNEKDTGISQAFYDKVKDDYAVKANLKKIDIGGGLIHGNAEDFRRDDSYKLVLAHTSQALTNKQKEIGGGATFGVIDVMIPDYQDYARRSAYYFLRSYFPNLPDHKLRILINNHILTYNSETILLKEGEASQNIYLLLTGNVEMISSKNSTHSQLTSGALIGEISGTYGEPSAQTYRASSFVQVLNIPISLYIPFIKENDLYSNIKKLQGRRDFLQKTWLFGDSVSTIVLNKVAQSMKIITIGKGEVVLREKNSDLYLIESGSIKRYLGPDYEENLGKGDFFGEETAIFNTPSLFRVKTAEPTVLYVIPGHILHEIPIVHWKLFETYERRKSVLLSSKMNISPVFQWKEEYAIHNSKIDAQHQKLLEMANIIYNAVEQKKDSEVIEDALYFLVNYTKAHFQDEEALMKKYVDAKEFDLHKKKHETFCRKVSELKEMFNEGDPRISEALMDFLKQWVVNHILGETVKFREKKK